MVRWMGTEEGGRGREFWEEDKMLSIWTGFCEHTNNYKVDAAVLRG